MCLGMALHLIYKPCAMITRTSTTTVPLGRCTQRHKKPSKDRYLLVKHFNIKSKYGDMFNDSQH